MATKMFDKTYTVYHLYMGELCCSTNQSYKTVVKTLSHVREGQIKGWPTKGSFFESLEKFMKVAQPGEGFMVGDLAAVVRERQQVEYISEEEWEFDESKDGEPDAYLNSNTGQSVWIQSDMLLGHDEIEDEPISGDAVVLGDGKYHQENYIAVRLVQDLIHRKDAQEDPSKAEQSHASKE